MTVTLSKILKNSNYFIEFYNHWTYWRKNITNFEALECAAIRAFTPTNYSLENEEIYLGYEGTVYVLRTGFHQFSYLSILGASPDECETFCFYSVGGSPESHIKYVIDCIAKISVRMESFYK